MKPEFQEYFPVLEDQERFARTAPRPIWREQKFDFFEQAFGALLALTTLTWIGIIGLLGWGAFCFVRALVGKLF